MPMLSPNEPWNGGIMAPPNIIMIKKADPWLVYFPSPATPSEKIHGHIIEQHNPPAIKAYTETIPFVKTPINIPVAANNDKVRSVLTGFSCPNKKAAIAIIIQTA